MADDADNVTADLEKIEELRRRERAARGEMPVGVEGDCDLCGEWSGRLVKGVCAPCRDQYGLE